MEQKRLLTVSPHVASRFTTRRIMIDVLIALTPAALFGIVQFGISALLTVLFSLFGAVAGEFFYNLLRKRKNTLSDCSALVTGLILGLNLPPAVPVYIPVMGGLFATMIVKMLFGGLGKNFANPAAAARVFLLLSFSSAMTWFLPPITYAGIGDFFSNFYLPTDVMTGATPLNGGTATLSQLFFGTVAGSVGETSVLALLIGGVYLIVRGVISWKVPVVTIFSTAAFLALFGVDIPSVLPQIMSGGLVLGAFFMATDYATSPNTVAGSLIYALGIGLFTALIRVFGSYPEGASLAILLMNLVTPLLDKYIIPKPFGGKKDVVLYVTWAIVGLITVAGIAVAIGGVL